MYWDIFELLGRFIYPGCIDIEIVCWDRYCIKNQEVVVEDNLFARFGVWYVI